jgi:hypothetical protein
MINPESLRAELALSPQSPESNEPREHDKVWFTQGPSELICAHKGGVGAVEVQSQLHR